MSKKEIVNVITIKTEESQNTIKGLKKEIADLKKTLDNAVIGSDEFEQASRDLAKVQNDLKTVMADGKKTGDAVEGSYNHLVQTMAELKKQWRATADEIKRNEIGQEIDRINSELKEMDSSIGNFQRNVGDYTNSFKDALDQQQKSTENARRTLDGLQKTASGLANGFAAVQGTMALLNIESSEFEQTMIKVQSAMAIAQGIGGMKDLIEGAGSLTVGFKNVIKGVKGFITGLKGVKAAIAATGIGILVVLLGELYANWDKISKFFKDTFAIESATDKMNNLKDSIEDNNDVLNRLNNEALKEYLSKVKEANGDVKKLKEAEDELTETNLKNALSIAQQNEQNARKIQMMAAIEYAEKDSNKNLKKLEEANKSLTDAERKRLEAEKALFDYNNNKNTDKNDSSNDRSNEAKSIFERARKLSLDTKEEELDELKRIYEEEKAILKQYGYDVALLTDEYLKKVEEVKAKYQYQNPIQYGNVGGNYDIETEMFQTVWNKKLEIDKDGHNAMLKNANDFAKKDMAIITKNAEEEKLNRKMVAQYTIAQATQTLGNLASIFGQETALGKAAAIAQATMDTYVAANSVLAQEKGGLAMKIIGMTAVITAGLANVANILKVEPNKDNTNTVNTTSPSVSPRINLGDNLPIQYSRDLLTDSELTNLNQSQKVYVVETDISDVQNKVAVAETNSSF